MSGRSQTPKDADWPEFRRLLSMFTRSVIGWRGGGWPLEHWELLDQTISSIDARELLHKARTEVWTADDVAKLLALIAEELARDEIERQREREVAEDAVSYNDEVAEEAWRLASYAAHTTGTEPPPSFRTKKQKSSAKTSTRRAAERAEELVRAYRDTRPNDSAKERLAAVRIYDKDINSKRPLTDAEKDTLRAALRKLGDWPAKNPK